MSNKQVLEDEVLEQVTGGSIDFTPDSLGATTGVVGINKGATHRYADYNAMLNFVQDHFNDKKWGSAAERDNYLFQGLIDAGIITPIE